MKKLCGWKVETRVYIPVANTFCESIIFTFGNSDIFRGLSKSSVPVV